MDQISTRFYTQNESRPNPQHGETALETSYIGGCLRTLTHTHTHTYTYTRSSGTTFTSSHNRKQHLKYSSFLIPIGDFRTTLRYRAKGPPDKENPRPKPLPGKTYYTHTQDTQAYSCCPYTSIIILKVKLKLELKLKLKLN
jgi:hypothetical protein